MELTPFWCKCRMQDKIKAPGGKKLIRVLRRKANVKQKQKTCGLHWKTQKKQNSFWRVLNTIKGWFYLFIYFGYLKSDKLLNSAFPMRLISQTDFSTSKLMSFSKCSRNFHSLYLELWGSQKQSRMSLHCSFGVLIVNFESRTRSLLRCIFYGTEHSKLAQKYFRKETQGGSDFVFTVVFSEGKRRP